MTHRSYRLVASFALVGLAIAGASSAGAISSNSSPPSTATTAGIPSATVNAEGQVSSFSGSSQSVPPMPSVSASTAAWQSWVTDWNDSLNAQGIATSFKEAGCTVTAQGVAPIPTSAAIALGFPAGIDPDGGWIFTTCGSKNSQERLRPMSTPGAGYSEATVGGPGSQDVESCYINGGANVCTTYGFGGYPNTIIGHVELTTDGILAMTCSVGSYIQDSGTETLGTLPNQSITVYDPNTPNGSNVWNGNFWTPNHQPYTNEGNVCAGI